MYKFFINSILLFLSLIVQADQILYPSKSPVIITEDAPDWLKNGTGRDGYLSIDTEVIPVTSCSQLVSKSFWGTSKTQIIISTTTSGFSSKLDDKEIPIATFDGRQVNSECTPLSVSPLRIISNSLLAKDSYSNQSPLMISVNVKSSNDSSQDYVGSAKLLLGAASLVSTGGVATAIGGVSATVENSIFGETQKRVNIILKGMIDTKIPISLNWQLVRERIISISVDVYRSEKSITNLSEEKLLELQNNTKDALKLFTIKFNFNFSRSILFPSVNITENLVNRENLSSTRILNTKALNSNQNYLQILNGSSPSLLLSAQRTKPESIESICSQIFDKLNQLLLSDTDIAIISKAFLDEANQTKNWYDNQNVINSCFNQAPKIKNNLLSIFGKSTPKFVIGDVQLGEGEAYAKWKNNVGPFLSDFRKALISKQNKLNALVALNHNKDIQLKFSPEIAPWQSQSLIEDDSNDLDRTKNRLIGIEQLKHGQIKNIGCYIYNDDVNLDIHNPRAYFLMVDENNIYYLSKAEFTNSENGLILDSLTVSEFNEDWRQHFKSYSFPGGECKNIL